MNHERATPPGIEQLLAESDWLRRLALGLVLDSHAADDIVQDTWVAALRRPPRASGGDLRGWLTVVARNFARRRRRDTSLRAHHEPGAVREGATHDPEAVAVRLELQRELAEALLALDEPLRTAIVLRFLDGLSSVQVAEQLGIGHDNARQRISRGLAKLRERLDRKHGSREAWLLLVQPFVEPRIQSEAPVPRPDPGPIKWLHAPATLTLAALLACAVVVLALRPTQSDGSRAVVLGDKVQGDGSSDRGGAGRGDAPVAAPSSSRTALASDLTASELGANGPCTTDCITGEVRDARGSPLPGAVVTAVVFGDADFRHLDASLGARRAELDTTHSDAAGRFRLVVGRRGVVQLEVDAGDRGACALGERHAGEHVVVTVPEPGSIRGRLVVARDRAPIAGAFVSASRAAPGKGEQSRRRIRLERATVSDARGEFLVAALSPGRYEVSASLAGGGILDARTLEVSAGVVADVELEVGELARVRGTVRDAVTDLPIVGAEVATSSEFSNSVRSDARGEFELRVPFEHLQELDARAPGYGVVDLDLRRSDASALSQVELALLPARSCKGVVRSVDGSPLAGAYVAVATNRHRDFMRIDWRAAETDAEGRFEIGDLRADMGLSILVREQGFGTRVYEIPDEASPTQLVDLGEIRLAPELEISGTVRLESGEPVPDVQLVLRGSNRDRGRMNPAPSGVVGTYLADRDGHCDAAGRYVFGELSAGDYWLDAYLDGHNDSVRVAVVLEEGRSALDVSVVIPAGRRLAGIVVDTQGIGIPGILVSAEPEVGDECGLDLLTDALGRFHAREVPAGDYTLSIWPDAAAPDRPGARYFARRSLPHVPAGSENIEIVLEEGAWVQGRVLEHDGSLAESYFVEVVSADGEVVAREHFAGSAPFRLGVRREEPFTILARPAVHRSEQPGERGPDPDPSHAARAPGVVGSATDLTLQLPPR